MRQLWAILAPHWRMALWACIATVGVTAAELFIPLLTGNVVDIAVSQQGYHTFPQLTPVASATLTLILVALTRWGFQFLRRYTAGRLSFDTISELRVRLLARLLHTDGPTQDQIRTGQVVSRSISDVQSIQGLVAMLPLAIGNLLQLLVTIIVMIALSPPLAIASLIWLPLIAWFARTSKQPLTQATHAAQQQAADVATRVEETITGIRIVQGFAQEQREVTALQRASILLYQARLHAAKVTARIQPLLEQLPQLALVCTIIAGAWMASQGTISVGIFVAFAMYVSRVTGVVRMLGNMSVRFHSGLASVARVSEISELTPDLPNGTLPVPDGPLSLEFQGVHFGGTLRDFSLKVPATATVVAVGPPASGKTLALQLAARFYDPDNGEILLQGIPLREYDRTEVRNAMAVVFDEPFLFEASIRDNLTLGADATEEELWRVLEAAQAAEFVRALPDSLDALVGERGLTLSGGQRQRIILARALLRRPRILLLDDATSAIDAATEANIFQAIETQFKETTVFAIAHRTSMTKLADYIAIMDAGHVVEVVPQASAKHSATFQRAMDLRAAVTTSTATRPSLNPTREDKHEFNSTLDPIAAECTPPGPQPKPVEITTPFSPYHMLRQTALGIVAVVLLLFGTVSADLAIPSLVRSVVDRSVTTGNTDILVSFALGGTGIVIAAWCIGVLRTLLTARIGERLLYALRVKSYQHVLNLDLAYFERTRTGALLTRMTTDIDNLSSFLQSALAQTIVASTTLIGIMIMLIVTAPSLALVAFSGIPIVIITTLIFRRYTSPLYTQAREELSAINAEFHEAVSGIRVIQMHGTQSQVLQQFQQQCEAYRRTRVRAQIAIATYFPGTNAIAQVSRALVIGFGASAVLNGDLSTGVLIAFLLYMGLLFDPIQELSQLFDAYQQARVSFQRITELLAEQPNVVSTGTDPDARQAAREALHFEDVSFAYSYADVLEDINLTITPGSTVALVGHTGAGKSTLMKLIARFYDPSSGTVRASATDIRHFPLHDWRATLGIVPQEPHLFTGTIAQNIAYGYPLATPEAIIDAARRVGALEAITNIEQGFQYWIGERGKGLSSGQRQLIALARAELVNPGILLLDEATATLDPATEKTVLDAAEQLTNQRTSIIVAHRLATAARADRILVLRRGRIIEDGTHQELLADEGAYAAMWHAQRYE